MTQFHDHVKYASILALQKNVEFRVYLRFLDKPKYRLMLDQRHAIVKYQKREQLYMTSFVSEVSRAKVITF